MSFEKPLEAQKTTAAETGAPFEREKPFDLEFYITDHSADNPDTGSPEKLRELYTDVKKDGIESVRYDWHWRNVEPKPGEYSEGHLGRYRQAKEIMEEVGLREPTIILSNPPEWAVKLYNEDKEKFFSAYRAYVEEVKNSLSRAQGEKIFKIQILNELNNTIYTPVKVGDLPEMCRITREVFRDYNPDVKLMATVIASNTIKYSGTLAEQYLPELNKIKNSFDIIAVDYYPGLWHLPVSGSPSLRPSEIFKHMVKQTELLQKTFEEIATWGKEYELGEVGLPTKKLWGGEKGQRYFYDAFFRAFKQLLLDLRSRGIKLPSRVGFYEAIDEPPRTLKGKILRKTPFPEHDMGMRKGGGERKLVLQGSPHLSEEERRRQKSQLSKIINYLRAPIGKSDESE